MTETPYCVFIDVPNITTATQQAHGRTRYEHGLKFDVPSLLEHIRHRFPGAEMVFGCAYDRAFAQEWRAYAANDWVQGLEASYRLSGLQFTHSKEKDIDSLIINDIWACVSAQREQQLRNEGLIDEPLRVRHVIVSGDGVYLRAYDTIQKLYGERISIELTVYGLNHHINEQYHQATDAVFAFAKF